MPPIDLTQVDQLQDAADDAIGRFRLDCILSTDLILGFNQIMYDDVANIAHPLTWSSIKFEVGDKEDIPNERGIYAFTIEPRFFGLPPNCFVAYIGISGTLRERYEKYLQPSHVRTRPKINRMVARWRQILRFYYATVPDDATDADLEQLEKDLNSTLLPPMSVKDKHARVKAQEAAF